MKNCKIVSWQCVGDESILLSRDYIMNGYSGKVTSSSIAKNIWMGFIHRSSVFTSSIAHVLIMSRKINVN